MSNIYVYPSGYVNGVLLNDSETDFSTAGLVGALSPTSCTFREIRNNERSIELEHPIDAEGRYKALVKGYILSVKVPVMTVPATGDSPIDITWNGTRTDYPSDPTQGYAFYLHSDDEETIDVNYYYSASALNAWRNGSTNIYTVGTYPVVGDTVYTLNSSNNATVRGTVRGITTSGETVTSITIKPNTGSDSKSYSRSASYDREINGMWYRFATDGVPIIWKGELYNEPANPQINWAYKDLEDGFTYYYSEDLEWVRLCDTSKLGQVWKYRVKSSYADKKKLRTVYKKKKKGSKLVVLKSGDEVFVLEKDEKEDKRWKVRTPRNGDGYMLPDALELVQGGEYDIRDNWKIIQDVISPWSVTTQLFRIYKVTKSMGSVKVEARDVAYDCLNNIYSSSYSGSITLAQMVKSLKTDTFGALSGIGSGYDEINFSTPDGYLIDNITKNEYKGKTLTEVMVGESNGICAKFNVIRVVDNYDVYFIKDPGINRGFTIQYGKNMTGVDYEINDDEIVTAVIPVGKNKSGEPLYLGPQKSKDAKKNYIGWAGNIIWSVNKDKYPTKRFYVLECDVQASSNKTAEIDYAMDQMRYLAESKIHADDKKTNAQDGDMDEPKITVTVEFINLGDTEEYKQFKNLEKCFLHDYVTIRHPDLGIDVTARVTEMEWDCLLDRMNKITLGNVKENEGRAAQYDAHQAQRAAYLAEQLGITAYEEASNKRRVFMEVTPTPPYDVGDLWITENKDLMVCVTAKDIDDEYSEDDWEIATKYTDTGLEWKGTFADVEELIEEYGDPVDGWAYRNSTDKKSYYYQNGSWNVITEDGYNGKNTAIVYLYKRSATAPSVDWTDDLTYNFSQKEITSDAPTGWYKVIPTGTEPLYVTAATAYSATNEDDIPYDEWSGPVLLGKSGEDGQDGSDGLNSATVMLYKRLSTKPTGAAARPSGPITYTFENGSVSGNLNGWSKTIPDGTDPCWVIQATAASTGTTDRIEKGEWTDTPTKLVEDGHNGKNTAIVYLYKRSTTAPTVDWTEDITYNFPQKEITSTIPTGWSKVIPTGTEPLYVTAATAYSDTNTDDIPYGEWSEPVLLGKNGEDGQDGSDGLDGLNSATVMLYKRAPSMPTGTSAAPSGPITYTFEDGSVSGSLNGWSRTVPNGTDPCWVIQATAASTGTTDRIEKGEWTDTPTKLVEDGVDGLNIATVILYKRSATSPAKPSGTLTYTFSTGQLTPTSRLNEWSQSIPASNGNPCYSIQKTAISTTGTFDIGPGDWSNPVIAFNDGEDGQDGQDGRDGQPGQNGQNGKSIGTVTNYYLATNDSSNVTRSTYGWTTSVQSVSSSKKYLWNYELIKYSDGTQAAVTDPCIIGSYGRDGTNGTNGTDGRGITGIIEKYQISASPTTAPTSWEDSPPAMTTAKPYLWNYEITTYTSGDPTQTTPRVIGAFGKSVVATTHYYKLSATKPQPPNVSASGWQTTEPTYTAGSTDKLWHCVMTSYSDGSSSYSPVSEAYSNVKIDTFISIDSAGTTFFRNSANNAAVGINSTQPCIVLVADNTELAKFTKDGLEFKGTYEVSEPAISVLRNGEGNPTNIVGVGTVPSVFGDPHRVELGTTIVKGSGIFVDHSFGSYSEWVYGAGNFKLFFNWHGYEGTYVLTTSKPELWDIKFYHYFTKSGSTYSQVTTTEAPAWEQNKYYYFDTGGGDSGEAWEDSEVEFLDNGQFIQMSGIISPTRDIAAGTTVGIMGFPEMYIPEKIVSVMCQGAKNSAYVWQLLIDNMGSAYFSGYRNGGTLAKCPAGTALPFHAMWMKSYPIWSE